MEAPRPDAVARRTRRPIQVPDEELEAAAARAAAEAEAARRAQHAAWRNPRTALLGGLRHQGGIELEMRLASDEGWDLLRRFSGLTRPFMVELMRRFRPALEIMERNRTGSREKRKLCVFDMGVLGWMRLATGCTLGQLMLATGRRLSFPVVQEAWDVFLVAGDWAFEQLNDRLSSHDPRFVFPAREAGWDFFGETELLIDGTIWYTPKYKGYVTKDYSMKHSHHGQKVQIVCNVLGQVVGLSRTFAGHHTDIYMLKHSAHIINALKFTVTQGRRELTQAHPTMTDGGYQGLGAIIGDRNHIRPKRKPPRGQLSEDDKLYNAQVYAKRQLNERVIGRIKAVMAACTKQWQGHRRKDVRKMSPLMCWAGDVHIEMFPMNRELPEDYAEAPADEPDEDMEDEEASDATSSASGASASESGTGASTG